jgi:hypothetical protein
VELLRHLTHDGDPLALAPLAHAAWLSQALVVPPSLLHRGACERIARALPGASRETLWAQWLQRHVAVAAEELRRGEPLDWRDVPGQPTPFEQCVASSFGVADTLAPRLIREFHGLPLEDRRALHALLPLAMFGLPGPEPRRDRRSERRARDAAKRATTVLRQLLAAVRSASG